MGIHLTFLYSVKQGVKAKERKPFLEIADYLRWRQIILGFQVS
jgi:hypothetical protein